MTSALVKFHCLISARIDGDYSIQIDETPKYDTYLFRVHTYFTSHEAIPDGESVITLLNIMSVLCHSGNRL